MIDQVSTCYKGLIPRVKGIPCQIRWTCSGVLNICASVLQDKHSNFNMENQNPRVPPLWEHSLTTLLGHDPTSDPGIALRQGVHFQGVHNILDLLSWDQEELKVTPTQQVYSLDDHGQGLFYLRTQPNQTNMWAHNLYETCIWVLQLWNCPSG